MAGGLVYTLGAQHQQFSAAMGQASIQVNHFHQSTRNAANGVRALNQATNDVSAGSGNAARGLLELSRGVEDAAVSFGTGGLQGAIRGSLNNLTQFAFLLGGPMAGALAGFTAAGVSLAATYLKIGDGAKEAQKANEDLIESIQKVASERIKFEQKVSEAKPKDVAGLLGGKESEFKQAEAELRASDERLRENRKSLAELQANEAQLRFNARKQAEEALGVPAGTSTSRVRAKQESILESTLNEPMQYYQQLIDAEMEGRETLVTAFRESERALAQARRVAGPKIAQAQRDAFEEAEREAFKDFEKARDNENKSLDRQLNEQYSILDRANAKFIKAKEDRLKAEEKAGAQLVKMVDEENDRIMKARENAIERFADQAKRNREFRATDPVMAGSKEAFDIIQRGQQSSSGGTPQDIVKEIKILTDRAEQQKRVMDEIKRVLRDKLDFERFEA